MKKTVISRCPICDQELTIEKLHCDHCNVDIQGEFTLSNIAKLNQEQLLFVEMFLKNQGNIKAVEKEMNISYPTVKKILNEVLQTLGYDKIKDNGTEKRREILEKLANKEISFDEANEKLKKI